MSTKTVRLDDESERALAEIREVTGMSVSTALKKGLFALRDVLRSEAATSPWEVYASIDLGPGGYARAPARKARSALRESIRAKHRR